MYSVDQLSARESQLPHSNIYIGLGRHKGVLELSMTIPAGVRVTVVVKE